MSDPATIAGITIGSKKLLAFCIGIGMVQAVKNFEWMRLWPLGLGILFAGAAYNEVIITKESHSALMVEQHKAIYRHIESELARRDLKINFSYKRATEGHRYTWEDSKRDASSYERDKDKIEKRLEKCEERLNNGGR